MFSAVFAIPEGESGPSPNPRGNNEKVARRPPRDPLTYTQIYDALAHLGLRYHVFYRPDQNRVLRQPPGGPRRPPAPPGGPPGHPPRPGSQSDRENTALRATRSSKVTCFTAFSRPRCAKSAQTLEETRKGSPVVMG